MKKNEASFSGFEIIEPSDLISFTKEYIKYQVKVLIPALMQKIGMPIFLIIARIKNDGDLEKTRIFGKIENFTDEGFSFVILDKDYQEDDIPEKRYISFRNVLGNVPFLDTDNELNPFEFNRLSDSRVSCFFQSLKKIKKLLESRLGEKHYAEIFLKYDTSHPNFRKNGFVIQCQVEKVNRSNVEIFHFRSYSFGNENDTFVDYVPRDMILPFLTREFYVYKVVLHPGTVMSINPYDDE